MKTRSSRFVLLAAAAVGLLAFKPVLSAADGNPPDRMTYQGFLVDSAGFPLGNTNTGPRNYDVIFRIFNDQSLGGAGNRLWTEMQTVTVDKGYFSVVLGEGGNYSSEARPALSSVFTNQANASDRFIEMTVRGIGPGGADSTLLPRLRLLPAPYAFLATTAVNARALVNSVNGQIMTVTDTNIGINKPAPTATLDVNGSVAASSLTVAGTTTLNGAVNAATLNVSGAAAVNGTLTADTFVGNVTIPVGAIVMWSGSTAPAGWALCDGGTYNGRTTPDLRGRFILSSGTGAGLTPRTYGQTGGTETHTLSTNEMPAHLHVVDPPNTATASDGSHSHSMAAAWGGGVTGSGGDKVLYNADGTATTHSTDSGGSHTHTVNIAAFNSASAGGGGAHNNMPPYYVLAFIMRVN